MNVNVSLNVLYIRYIKGQCTSFEAQSIGRLVIFETYRSLLMRPNVRYITQTMPCQVIIMYDKRSNEEVVDLHIDTKYAHLRLTL